MTEPVRSNVLFHWCGVQMRSSHARGIRISADTAKHIQNENGCKSAHMRTQGNVITAPDGRTWSKITKNTACGKIHMSMRTVECLNEDPLDIVPIRVGRQLARLHDSRLTSRGTYRVRIRCFPLYKILSRHALENRHEHTEVCMKTLRRHIHRHHQL